MKKFKMIFLIITCLALLTGIVFASFNNNQAISQNSVGEIEKKNMDEGYSKEKINELYMELTKENILKKIQPRLETFGIIDRVKEDKENNLEKEVTREELAKFIVKVLGMESAAEYVNVPNLFTDVDEDMWSYGYITIVATRGVIKGKDDGSFGPGEPVSYADAIEALVRMLGYEDEFLRGNSPNNFIAKAVDIGITKDVKYNSLSSIVDHGDMLILIDNTLRANGLQIEDYREDGGITVRKSEENFLKTKHEINQYDKVRILEIITKNVNSKDEINLVKFKFLTDMYNDKYKTGDIKIFRLLYKDIEKLQNFVSQEVTIYINDDNEVVYIEK